MNFFYFESNLKYFFGGGGVGGGGMGVAGIAIF